MKSCTGSRKGLVMDMHLDVPPRMVRQLGLKVREVAERRAQFYRELYIVLRELAELAERSKRRRRLGDL